MLKQIAKGHRSIVYGCKHRGKMAVKKVEKKDINVLNRIQNEIYWLKKLNNYNIGPKLYSSDKNYFICEFVEGERIIDFLKKSKNPLKIILKIIDQCRKLDKLNVDKKEMNYPYKHIIISMNKVTFIDFERARFSLKPKNVTGFFSFLLSKLIYSLLQEKNLNLDRDKIKELLQNYKKTYSDDYFKKLIIEIKLI